MSGDIEWVFDSLVILIVSYKFRACYRLYYMG